VRGLYAIVDTDALARRGLPVEPFFDAVLAARPALVQLRDKHGGARATLALAQRLAPRADAAGVPFVLNDRVDLAWLSGAAGVHLGQTDLPVGELARLEARLPSARRLVVGLSTHTDDELDLALAEPRLDYVAIGPVFSTDSKTGREALAPTLGVDVLASRAARARRARPGLPVCAIGGLELARAALVAPVVDLVAVIAALLPEQAGAGWTAEVQARAEALGDAIARTTRP
jgi:thiamine-phosphate pyrophosphorylase